MNTLAGLRQSMVFPVLMKEMRSRMRGTRAPALLLASAGTSVIIGIIILAVTGADLSGDPAEHAEMMAQTGRTLFLWMVGLEAVLAALMAPALTAGAISAEREQQTLELLLLTRLSGANIVLGKLFSSLSFLVIVLLSALPVTAVAFVFGGVSVAQLVLSQLLILAMILCFGAFGLCCSARFTRTATATVVAYIVCAVWVALLPLLRFLLELYGHVSLADGDILIALLLSVAVLLIGATVPTVATSALVFFIRNLRLPRVWTLSLWGLFASLACLVLYLPGALNHLRTEYFLFANPAYALTQVLTGEIFEASVSNPSYASYTGGYLPPFSTPARALTLDFMAWLSIAASFVIMLLAAWGGLALAVLQVRRQAEPGGMRRRRPAPRRREGQGTPAATA